MDLLPNQARVFGNAIKLQLYRKLCFTFAKKNQKIKNQAKSGYSYITVLQYSGGNRCGKEPKVRRKEIQIITLNRKDVLCGGVVVVRKD